MSASDAVNRQVVLTRLPKGHLSPDLFELREAPVPVPGPGEALCRTRLLSIDAANRAWMQGATYRSAIEGGDVMAGFALAEVVASNDPALPVGAIVEADQGWQDYAVHPARRLSVVQPRLPLSNHLSVLGVTGLTAWFGLLRVGRPVAGETVLVSAAGGATGNVVCQLAKRAGCRVVGIAGSDDKRRYLETELGVDATVSHRDPELRRSLKDACPEGVDVYFDNTAGPLLDLALSRMNMHGRIVCCGAVSNYDGDAPTAGPRGVPGLLVTKRLRMEGFIVMDFYAERDTATNDLAAAVADGSVKVVEDVIDGLERAPQALVGLLAGENIGKRMVRVSA